MRTHIVNLSQTASRTPHGGFESIAALQDCIRQIAQKELRYTFQKETTWRTFRSQWAGPTCRSVKYPTRIREGRAVWSVGDARNCGSSYFWVRISFLSVMGLTSTRAGSLVPEAVISASTSPIRASQYHPPIRRVRCSVGCGRRLWFRLPRPGG